MSEHQHQRHRSTRIIAVMTDDTMNTGSSQGASSQSLSQSPTSASSSKAPASGISTSASIGPAPPGYGLRRSFTVDDSRKRRQLSSSPSASARRDLDGGLRRRSSNLSNYSFGEARDILNPHPQSSDDDFSAPESSSLASISLAFALLPALAGAVFKNGSALVTDLMLLGLSGVFLHWSVTQPW